MGEDKGIISCAFWSHWWGNNLLIWSTGSPQGIFYYVIMQITKWSFLYGLWPQVGCSNARTFLAATLVTVRPGGFRCEQMLLLRDEATPALQCLFYTIDRPLPPLEKGQLVRWESPNATAGTSLSACSKLENLWTDFHETCCYIPVLVEVGHFTWRPTPAFLHNSLNICGRVHNNFLHNKSTTRQN